MGVLIQRKGGKKLCHTLSAGHPFPLKVGVLAITPPDPLVPTPICTREPACSLQRAAKAVPPYDIMCNGYAGYGVQSDVVWVPDVYTYAWGQSIHN